MILTTSIEKIRRIKSRKKIIQGGSSSGKTWAILTILIDWAIKNEKKSVSVVSESMPHLRRGALRDFLHIMKDTGRYIDSHYNKSSLTYTFSNGSYIEFFSADQPDKLKGARRSVLYINECNNVSYEAYQQLSIRTHSDIYLDYNPDRSFWAITDVSKEPDAETIILNYLDNEALPDNVIEQFEINKEKAKTSDYWKNWCKVYIDGELGSLEGVVFNNWMVTDYLPEEAELIGVGMDFGFTNDPTAAVAVWKSDGVYYLDELFYEKNMVNSTIDAYLKEGGVGKEVEIWADSADPKTIKEIKNWGWRIAGAQKGPDSINWGITIMQEVDLKITRRSSNLIDELQNYQWAKDKWGMKTNKPIDAWNHAIDATRYLFMSKLGKRNSNKTPFVIGGGKAERPFF
jgi:phage terminase large subunit